MPFSVAAQSMGLYRFRCLGLADKQINMASSFPIHHSGFTSLDQSHEESVRPKEVKS